MADQKTIVGKIRFKRDTTENWIVNQDIIPGDGEPCYDTTLKKIKIGNGVSSYKDLDYLCDSEINSLNEELKALIGEEPVGSQISKAINKLHIEDICKINSIKMGNTLLDIIKKSVTIPIATNNSLGVVMGSDEINIQNDGKVSVEKINIDKIVQNQGQSIILNSGNSERY